MDPIAQNVGDRRAATRGEDRCVSGTILSRRRFCSIKAIVSSKFQQFPSILIFDGRHKILKASFDRLHQIGSFQSPTHAKQNPESDPWRTRTRNKYNVSPTQKIQCKSQSGGNSVAESKVRISNCLSALWDIFILSKFCSCVHSENFLVCLRN